MFVHISDEESERLHENCLNIVKRHCRIGKVSFKTGVPWVDKGIKYEPPQPPRIWEGGYIPWWQRGPWCGQASGYVHTTKATDVPLVPSHGVLM